MNTNEKMKYILSRKGQFSKVAWNRECKVKKGAPLVRKITSMAVCRLGVNYENMEIVKEKRASGELPKESQGLPSWCEWECFPHIGKNKNTGELYLRVYPKADSKHSHYEIDGQSVDYKSVEKDLAASEKNEQNHICQWIKLNDVTEIV